MRFIYGDLLPHLPEGFVPPEEWPEYGNVADPAGICAREEVGAAPRGIRWALWPLCFEEYTGDAEPDMAASRKGRLARARMVMWHRIRRNEIPKGWRAFSRVSWRVDGVRALLPDTDVTSGWHKNSRRDLRLWKEKFSADYALERVTPEEYAAGYRQSLIAKRVDLERLYQLQRRERTSARDHIEYWVVRNRAGAIAAGTAIIYSPTYQHSAHFAPFITEEGRRIYAATALVEHWFKETQRRGYRFAVSTNFWFDGQPRGWKGFSEFKSHFGFEFVAYPPTLYRFVGGKIF